MNDTKQGLSEGAASRRGRLAAPLPRRKSLRNANINYSAGCWAVTIQVAKNKSLLGAIVGDTVVLNELGQKVDVYWRGLPAKYPELELFDYIVMPNHIHALLRIHWCATNREHHLGFLMSRFKGGTSYIYGKMCREGRPVYRPEKWPAIKNTVAIVHCFFESIFW